MRKNIILTILFIVLSLHGHALVVSNTAGNLSSKVTNFDITSLKVNGTMNAVDFYFIADNLKKLSTVDLGGVRITACTIDEQHYWNHKFVADEVPVGAFGGMMVETVVLPSQLRSIGKAAFAACHSLSSITLPETLDSISDYAFAGCTSLTTVTLPASVTIVGVGAFMRCTSLSTFAVQPASRLKRIDATALMDCPALKNLSLGTAVQKLGERSLAGTGIEHLDLSACSSLTQVGDAFMVKTPVVDAALPASLTGMGVAAFLYDTDLASVSLGGNLTDLSDFLFAGTGLNGDLVLEGITSVGDYALYNVTGLSVVELPPTVTWLGSYAMAGMTGLTALTSNATVVPALGEHVWRGVNQSQIPLTVPAGSQKDYQAAAQWKEFLFESGWIKGDVNNDGEVNIADINAVVSIILGAQVSSETWQRADVNGDGEINIADINAVVGIVLSPNHLLDGRIDTDDQLHMNPVNVTPGQEYTVNILLDNADNYSALQCDITLPQGLSLVSAKAGQGQLFESSDMDASTTRTLMYSMDKRQFSADGPAVLSFTVKADASLATESQILLSNVVLSDDADVAWHAADAAAQVTNSTGIEDLTANADRVWIEGRTLCIDTRQSGSVQVAAVNGTTQSMRLAVGANFYDLEPGFYVVLLNGKSYKIAIK